MNYEDILANLKKKIYHPVYFLMGEESYFIDQITNYISKNVLTDAEKGFNQHVLYGKDTDVDTIITHSRRFPMMANHQVIIVKEAQNIRKIEDLEAYIKAPLKSTILVINYKYKSIDKRKGFAKQLAKNCVLFESKKIYDNKLPAWINGYLSSQGYSIEPQASAMLAEYLGTDLSKVSNELNKLIISLPKGTKISPDHIEKNIGISKDYNIFELQNALGTKNVLKTNQIINYFAANPATNPFTRTIGSLYFYFSKLLKFHFLKDKSPNSVASALQINPFFVRSYTDAAKVYNPKKLVAIIGILREYDMKSKGMGNVSASHGDLQKEMIYKILH